MNCAFFAGLTAASICIEDEGDNYNYEKGAHALIPVRWSETDKKLTIGDREGQYPGMPKELQFNIVWVSPGHGTGETVEGNPDSVLHYQGKAISAQAPVTCNAISNQFDFECRDRRGRKLMDQGRAIYVDLVFLPNQNIGLVEGVVSTNI